MSEEWGSVYVCVCVRVASSVPSAASVLKHVLL